MDDTAIAGAPNASTTVAGIVQFPTDAQREAGTDTGSTGAGLSLPNRQYGARYIGGYAVTGGAVNVITVSLTPAPTTLATGLVVGMNITTNTTGNATLNVNGLGAKNILLGGTGLFAGAFATSMTVGVEYNGTQFDVIWRTQGESASATGSRLALRNALGDVTVNTTPTNSTDAASKAYVDTKILSSANGTTTKNAADASTTQNIAHGLGEIPKSVEIFATLYSNAIPRASTTTPMTVFANTFYNGTTQSSQSLYVSTAAGEPTQGQTFTLNASGDNGTQTGVVTFDATNIIITWTKTNSPTGTYNLLWRALAS